MHTLPSLLRQVDTNFLFHNGIFYSYLAESLQICGMVNRWNCYLFWSSSHRATASWSWYIAALVALYTDTIPNAVPSKNITLEASEMDLKVTSCLRCLLCPPPPETQAPLLILVWSTTARPCSTFDHICVDLWYIPPSVNIFILFILATALLLYMTLVRPYKSTVILVLQSSFFANLELVILCGCISLSNTPCRSEG